MDKRCGQLETLLHPAGELVGAVAPPVFQAQFLEERVRPARRLTSGHAVQPAEMHDLVTSRHPWVEPAFLRHVAPVAAVLLAHQAAVISHLAVVRAQHPEHDPQERRLASAVWPEQTGDHPWHHVEAHSVEGHPVDEGVPDVVDLEGHAATLPTAGPTDDQPAPRMTNRPRGVLGVAVAAET